MEPDLAPEGVETAAPVADAGNELEREKSSLLERMEGSLPEDEIAVAETEPEVEDDVKEQVLADEAARKQAHESVAREFPDALKVGSELYQACREELEYLRETNSPLADDPLAEYKIARRMVRVMGLSLQRVATAPVKSAPQQRRSVRPMPTGGAPVESPVTTLERRVAGVKSTGEMLDLMREIGTPFEALLKRR